MDIYEYDLSFVRGATFSQEFSVKSSGNPLEGKTAKSQIRPKRGSETLSAEFNCSVSDGRIIIGLTTEQTLALSPGKYEYDIAVIGDGTVDYFFHGIVTVFERVTVVNG